MASGELIGKVIHVFDKINVAVIRLSGDLKVGDSVHFLGSHTDFQQEITSMQVEHQAVSQGKAGGEVAVKATQRVRSGDSVYRLGGGG
jgi:putative protease